MKFAKELERDAVPEWRIKYLNYKAGKKHIKAVARAINRANATPRSLDRRTPTFFTPRHLRTTPQDRASAEQTFRRDESARSRMGKDLAAPHSDPIPITTGTEDQSLTGDGNQLQYGSFVASPTAGSPLSKKDSSNRFELPAPALHVAPEPSKPSRPVHGFSKSHSRFSVRRSASLATVPTTSAPNITPSPNAWPSRQATGGPIAESPSHRMRRLLSHSGTMGTRDSRNEIGMQNFDLVREREHEFYEFMDSELDKIDTFYKLKEDQAGQRLSVLREQLHEMRNRRIQELDHLRARGNQHSQERGHDDGPDKMNGWVNPFKAKLFAPGPNSKALQAMPRTPNFDGRRHNDASRDYIRRPEDNEVSYRTAKRKLKLALQEFYRGLELLKSYAMLNRTAFRKLNKKFDKAANARPPYRYMNDKVNKAWFVNSDVLEGHIKAVEDLYARYFERGNHKLAAGKLRNLGKLQNDESGTLFQNGFLVGTGLVFTVQGLIYGAQLLFDDDPVIQLQTVYLMQIYGGYFLMLLIFALFCVDCAIWTRNKVNYPFIFEFDPRHHLDWRRLAEFPSFFLLLFGIFLWMNFSGYGPDYMYLYYPVILIFVTTLIILLPAPVLAHKSRRWFAYAHWRLLLAGIYPVEFRDFFLGDIYCSLTYAMANLELFPCLYAKRWNNPAQCNSNHSRLLGFLTALPAIWRFLQCIRRYRDTRNVFPHLVNCGKYSMSIMYAVTLSLYRVSGSSSHLALFVTFAAINGIYTSIWDLFMDFSLLQSHSRHYYLRDILAFKRRWPYYTIMVLDPILRNVWIFYAIFAYDRQHSTVVSFVVSLLEVIRRGMWTLFRVENEHSSNVSQYKASRDVPLPYRIEPLMDRASAESSPMIESQEHQAQDVEQSTASSTAVASTLETVRRRRDTTSVRNFSKIMAEAHKQDFQKKRKPGEQAENEGEAHDPHSDDDEEEEEDDEEVTASLLEVREAADLRRGGNDE